MMEIDEDENDDDCQHGDRLEVFSSSGYRVEVHVPFRVLKMN